MEQLINYCHLHLIKFSVIIDIIETFIPIATDFSTRKPVQERTLHYYKFLAVMELNNFITAVNVECRIL